MFRKPLILLPTFVSLMLGYFLCCTGEAEQYPIREAEIQFERAVLAEDWQRVLVLTSEGIESSHKVLVRAHACLALNKNNESLRLFRSASSEDQKKWRRWTERFAKRYPEGVVAHYLKGDALVRQGEFQLALKCFNEALELYPKHALTLNARGVLNLMIGNAEEALDDFEEAKKAYPSFADVYANLGIYWIQQKEGAPKIIKSLLKKAMELSENFPLAEAAYAVMNIIEGNLQEAEKNLLALRKDSESIYKQVITELGKWLQKETELPSELANVDPKMWVNKNFSKLKNLLNQKNLYERMGINWGYNYKSLNRKITRLFNDTLKIGAKYPELQSQVDQGIGKLLNRYPFGRDNLKDAVLYRKGMAEYGDFLNRSGVQKFVVNIGYKGTGGGLHIGPFKDANKHLNFYKKIDQKYLSDLTTSKPQGVVAGFSKAIVETGEWPPFPYFGLNYTLAQKEVEKK